MKTIYAITILTLCGSLTACLGGGTSSGGGLVGPTPTPTTTTVPVISGGGTTPPVTPVTTTTLPSRASMLTSIKDDLNSQPGGNGLWATLRSSATGRPNFAVLQGPDGKAYAIDVTRWTKGQTINDMVTAGIAVPNLEVIKTTKTVYGEIDYKYVNNSGWACPISEYCTKSYPNKTTVYSWKNPDGTYSTGGICPLTYSWDCNKSTIDGSPYYTWDERVSIYGNKTETTTDFKDPVTGIIFEEGDYSSKDLESIGAALNDETIATVRNGLVSQFGLSESRAGELASMANSMSSVLKNQGRAMTERDLQALQVKAMGFTASDFINAKKAGDKKHLTELAERAAKLNKISLEQAKRLLNQMAQ